MPESSPLTADQFSKRLVELCLRSNLAGIPKKDLDQQILLKSAVLLIDSSGVFTEKEISARLEIWVRDVCQIQNFDRVSLRRWLVDSGYLTRSSDGAAYQIAQPGPRPELFAPEIDHLDVIQVLSSARVEIARRKQEFMQKSKEH
jgi:hypothetical protein